MFLWKPKNQLRLRFWNENFQLCQILDQTFYKPSVFESCFCELRPVFNKVFYYASDFASKNLQPVRFWFKSVTRQHILLYHYTMHQTLSVIFFYRIRFGRNVYFQKVTFCSVFLHANTNLRITAVFKRLTLLNSEEFFSKLTFWMQISESKTTQNVWLLNENLQIVM